MSNCGIAHVLAEHSSQKTWRSDVGELHPHDTREAEGALATSSSALMRAPRGKERLKKMTQPTQRTMHTEPGGLLRADGRELLHPPKAD